MAEGLLNDKVNGYEVSTIRTDAGGAAPSYFMGLAFFSSAGEEDLQAWPYETMVFRVGPRKGLYHEPHADENAAREGHARIVAAVTAGTLEFGTTVQGEHGNPLITPEEWFRKQPKAELVEIGSGSQGQNFASVATIRAAVFDVIDAGDPELFKSDGVGHFWLLYDLEEDFANAQRVKFADFVIKRIAELQSPPHSGLKLENLCDPHKRRSLPAPTTNVCVMCEAERKVKTDG